MAPAPVIIETPLPELLVGDPIEIRFSAMGGEPTLTWALNRSIDGLQLSFDGLLTGSPEKSGAFTLGVSVRDTRGREASADFPVSAYEVPVCGISELRVPRVMGGALGKLEGRFDRWLPPELCGEGVAFQAYELRLDAFARARTYLATGLTGFVVGADESCTDPSALCTTAIPEDLILEAGDHTLFLVGPRDGAFEVSFEAAEIGHLGSCEMPVDTIGPRGQVGDQLYRPDPPAFIGNETPFYTAYRTGYTGALDAENVGVDPFLLAVVRGPSCDGEVIFQERLQPKEWARLPASDTGMVFIAAGEFLHLFAMRFHSYAGDGICTNPRRVEIDGDQATTIEVDLRREAEQPDVADCFVDSGFIVELVNTSTGSVELDSEAGSTPVGFAVGDACPLVGAVSCQEQCIDFTQPGTRYVAIGPTGTIEQAYDTRISFRPRSTPCE